jgi:hypothetical protein
MFAFPLALTVLLTPPAAPAEPPPQWVLVTAPAFRKAVEPLVEQRKAQGFRTALLQTTDVLTAAEITAGDSSKLCAQVHKRCREHRGPSLVLLVGAIDGDGLEDAGTKVLPPGHGTAGRMKGQPTDNPFGCPEGGRTPTVAVGRLPARSEAEARAMIAKTLCFENDPRPDAWRRRLTVLAGIPAYNPLVDRMVERLAMARFERLSPVWSGRAIYTNPQSPFCVPDGRLRTQALEYVQDGQAFILYLGHSSPQGLYGGNAPFLNRNDWSRLRIAHGPGVFLTFGCNGCQLAGSDGEGYGVAAVRNPNGPCAVVGSHGICFAAMVQLAADALFESSFTGKLPQRLGDTWLSLQRGVAEGKIDALTFKMLDAVDGDSSIPQPAQRQEHLEMFVLLGDPALRLPAVPEDLEVKADGPIMPGAALTIRGRVPQRLAGARVRLTLERSVASEPAGIEPLPQGLARDRVMQANHDKANRFVLANAEAVAREGRFEARLTVPDKLSWRRLLLRAYAATDTAEATKVLPLEVRVPAEQPRR